MKRRISLLGSWMCVLAALLLSPARLPAADKGTVAEPQAPATQPAPATSPAPKIAPPDGAHRAPALKLVNEVFAKEYANKTPAGKKALAQALLLEAAKSEDNPVTRFVLLQEGLGAAIAGADVEMCRKALADLEHSYTVDIDELTIEAFLKFQNSASEETLSNWGAEAARQMIERDSYTSARRIVSIVFPKVAKSKDAAGRAALQSIQSTLSEYEKVRPVLEKLKADPGDAAANAAAGRFYCFVMRNYGKGLPLLVRGNDVALKEVAQKDIDNPSDAMARYHVAGYWWDLSQDKTHAALQAPLRERAAYWYAMALPELTGLEKVVAEKRKGEKPIAVAPAPTAAPAASNNMISKMKLEGIGKPLDGGAILITQGRLKTPEEVAVPFKAEFVAKTDSTNIRLGFNRGLVILNWELNPSELRHHDPVTGRIRGIKGAGSIPVEQFVQITWILLPDSSKVFVNGQERAVIPGYYKDVHGFISIFPANGSTITVKSVNITTGNSAK